MVDETTKVDIARQDRLREQQAEKQKPKTQESEFDQLLKKGQLAQPVSPTQTQTKTVTEQAIRESSKHQDQEKDGRKKDEGEKDEKREGKQSGQRQSSATVDHKVIGKAGTSQGDRGSSGGGREGGFESAMGRRSLSKSLSKAGAKSLPLDLRSQFASRLAKAQATSKQPAITQQILNKLVQYVRIGLNRAGEKEIQVDLHEKIFRGLKLRVTSRAGKVSVHLQTADVRGREVFEKNKDAILKALSDKGIDVAELKVS